MNINQHRFITEYLRHRSAYTAYCIAYQVKDETKYDSIMCAAQQLLDDPDIGGVIRSVLEGARYEAEQEIRAELKTDILTIQRKREILARIANGDMYIAQNYKGKDCTQCTQMVTPTINQMLKAIDLDNKMAGHYSVDKRQLTPYPPKGETNVVEPQQHSETVSLHPIKQTSITQQNTTIQEECPPLAGVSAGRGWNTRKGQQNTTKVEQEETPLLTKEGRIANSEAVCNSGEVKTLAKDTKPQQPATKHNNFYDTTDKHSCCPSL